MFDMPSCLVLLKSACFALLLGMLVSVFPGSAAAHGDPQPEKAFSSAVTADDMTRVVMDECCHLDGFCVGKVLPGSKAEAPIDRFGEMMSIRLGRREIRSLTPIAEPPPPRL